MSKLSTIIDQSKMIDYERTKYSSKNSGWGYISERWL